MARASHVYLVSVSAHPVAAFTVKHECASWLARWYPRQPTNLRVHRFPDGDSKKAPVNMTDAFYPTEGEA